MIYSTIILALACLSLGLYTYRLERQLRVKVKEDSRQQEKNDRLRKEGEELAQANSAANTMLQAIKQEQQATEQKLNNLRISVDAQQNVLKSLTATSESLRKAAQQQADEAYQARFEALAADYAQKESQYKEKYDQAISIMNRQLLTEQDKLQDLEAKQKAYIRAQQREQEIQEQKDYYRLTIDDQDLSDVHQLRELQLHFAKKEVIDKVIWETYYRPAFDALVGRVLKQANTTGIYKITSLKTGQAYIGQSVDLKERFRQHVKAGLSTSGSRNYFYSEMFKQGPENFTFEVLEEVPRSKLNERETYWIEFYDTKNSGLNSTKGGA